MKKAVAFLLLTVFAVSVYSGADMNLCFGFPFLGARFSMNERLSGELRLNYDGGVGIIGARGYYNFISVDALRFFSGLELGYTFFSDVDDLDGIGLYSSLFVGCEYFLAKKLSLSGDIGAAYIYLSSKQVEGTFDTSGIEWVFNLSVNYYFK